MEGIETQPEEIIEEQTKAGFLERIELHKLKFLGGFLGALIFVCAIFGAYKLGQRQIQPPQPTPTPEVDTPTPDPTAGWQTYTNAKYGYSIKYPKDWNTSEPEGGPEKDRRINFHPWRERSFEEIDYQISIIVNEVSGGDTLTSWLDEKIGSYPEEIQALITRENVILDNFEGEKVLEEPSQAGVYNIYTQEGQFVYNFILAPYSPKDLPQLLPESLDYFNLMLSTFRFLEEKTPTPSPTAIEKIFYKPISGWQTYNDSQAKFSVQYPESYKLASSNPGKEVIFWNCFDDPQKGEICLSGYMVRVYEDYDGGSRRAWFERLRPDFLIDPYYEDVRVAGIKALIIMDGNLGGSTGSFVLIPKGNRMFLFDFPGGWNPETKEKPGLDFIKQVLSTFRFLE